MEKNKIYSVIIFVMASFLFANRGMIPFDPNITIFAPNQRAMIAWNGQEQILLLSTDISASDSTMVLEVLPLPSEPTVKKGAIETFQKAVSLINRKIAIALRKKGSGRLSEGIAVPAGEVTFHKRIGAHDISVVHLLDADGFIEWVKEYLKSRGVEKEILSEEMVALIAEYIEEKFVWFVFDVITLGKETATNEPIQYRFKTNSLYYPLKISKTGQGRTSIELLILTPQLLKKFPGLAISKVYLKHDPIVITDEELKEIDQDMSELFGKQKEMKLRIWGIEGDIRSFDRDLIAR